MDDSKSEPFEPGEGSPEPGEGAPAADDRLRERVSAARASIGEALREAVERLEQSERAALAAAEDRLSRIAADRVDDALVRLGMEKGRLQAEVERRTDRAIERVAADIGARFDRAQAGLEEVARRSAMPRADDEARMQAAVNRIEQAMSRVERAIAEIDEAERAVRATEQRVVRLEGRVRVAAETAARAVDLETRMSAAARIEAEAARRIEEAERRLLGRVEELGDEPTGEAPR